MGQLTPSRSSPTYLLESARQLSGPYTPDFETLLRIMSTDQPFVPDFAAGVPSTDAELIAWQTPRAHEAAAAAVVVRAVRLAFEQRDPEAIPEIVEMGVRAATRFDRFLVNSSGGLCPCCGSDLVLASSLRDPPARYEAGDVFCKRCAWHIPTAGLPKAEDCPTHEGSGPEAPLVVDF